MINYVMENIHNEVRCCAFSRKDLIRAFSLLASSTPWSKSTSYFKRTHTLLRRSALLSAFTLHVSCSFPRLIDSCLSLTLALQRKNAFDMLSALDRAAAIVAEVSDDSPLGF